MFKNLEMSQELIEELQRELLNDCKSKIKEKAELEKYYQRYRTLQNEIQLLLERLRIEGISIIK